MLQTVRQNLWVGFYIENLALWIAQQSLNGSSASALAVHESGLVYQASPQAIACGIRPGMSQANALSRCPQLFWIARNPQAESQYLQEQCWWLSGFTPHLCQEAGCLLAEVSHSLKLFGGLQSLVQQMIQGFRDQQQALHLAVASTPRAAVWLSSWKAPRAASDPFAARTMITAISSSDLRHAIAPIDIHCLAVHTETDRQAQQLRIMRDDLALMDLQALWALPRKALRQRLGARALLAMDQALGLEPDPRQWLCIPEPLRLHRELSFWAEESSHLFKLGQTLIEQACAHFKARQVGVMRLNFQLYHRDRGPVSLITLGTQALCQQAGHWSALWAEHLAKTLLRDPVTGITLCSGFTQNMPPASETLFPGPELSRQAQTALFERLQARLGSSSIGRIVPIADHRPEFAQQICALNPSLKLVDPKLNDLSFTSIRRAGLPRPLWFFENPVPIQERSNRPYWQGPLKLIAGPERIETAWWDGQWFARDYFIASDEQAALYWIYRSRQDASGEARLQWFIQGCFG